MILPRIFSGSSFFGLSWAYAGKGAEPNKAVQARTVNSRFIIFAPWKEGWGNRFGGDGTPSAGVPSLVFRDRVRAAHDLAADLLEPFQLAHREGDLAMKRDIGSAGDPTRDTKAWVLRRGALQA